MYYVYLLKSKNRNQTYIGSTSDLKRRLKEHNDGKSFSTKRYVPWKLIYYEAFESEKLARIRERNLKYNGNAVRELKKRILMPGSGAGYTLIEILVGITIIGIVFSIGFVSFREFSRRQAVAGAAKQIKGDLRLAQEQALAGKKPEDAKCAGINFLNGYNFRVDSAGSYVIDANCTGGLVELKSVDLQPDLAIFAPSPNPIVFNVLGRGTNIPQGGSATLALTQAGTNNQVTITVTSGGEIK